MNCPRTEDQHADIFAKAVARESLKNAAFFLVGMYKFPGEMFLGVIPKACLLFQRQGGCSMKLGPTSLLYA